MAWNVKNEMPKRQHPCVQPECSGGQEPKPESVVDEERVFERRQSQDVEGHPKGGRPNARGALQPVNELAKAVVEQHGGGQDAGAWRRGQEVEPDAEGQQQAAAKPDRMCFGEFRVGPIQPGRRHERTREQQPKFPRRERHGHGAISLAGWIRRLAHKARSCASAWMSLWAASWAPRTEKWTWSSPAQRWSTHRCIAPGPPMTACRSQ